jgi:hypothetical protein
MQLISSVTVGAGGAASISFSSIPSTFTDLLLVISARADTNAVSTGIFMQINGVTTNRTSRWLAGVNGSVFSVSDTSAQVGYLSGATSTSNVFTNTQLMIPNYSGSNNKSFSVEDARENNDANAALTLMAGLWSSTAAITSLTLQANSGSSNFVQHSMASLYGILKGSGGATVS